MNINTVIESAESVVQEQLRKSAPPRPLTRRHALTLWSGDGLPSAVQVATPLLLDARPAVVQLHAGPQGLRDHLRAAAFRVRATLPDVALWVGVAWDGWVDEVTAATVDRVIERVYLPAAKAARDIGAELLVINSEAAGKVHPKAARLLACVAIDRIRAECPGLAIGHTAYDHPHYHPEERDHGGKIDPDEEGYPWSAYLGGAQAKAAGVELPKSGPVDLELPQRYAAPAKPEGRPQPMAGVGSLQRRIAGSRASFARAAALGWIDPAVPVLSYVQAHHVDARDTAAVGASQPLALWAAPTRLDDHGRRALRVLCAAERGELGADLGQTDWPVITAWAQGRVGAVGDGQWGAKSTAAALDWLRERGLDGDGRFGAELLKALQVWS